MKYRFLSAYRMKIAIATLFALVIVVDGLPALQIRVGEFTNKHHGVSGTVYYVDQRTFLIKGFTYDGAGPDAFFLADTEAPISKAGTILPYPFNDKFYEYDDPTAPILQRSFDGNMDITLTTPKSLNASDVVWLSVWCRKYEVDFGSFTLDFQSVNEGSAPEPEVESEAESEPEHNQISNHIADTFETSPVKAEPEGEPANPETEPILGYGSTGSCKPSMMITLNIAACILLLFRSI